MHNITLHAQLADGLHSGYGQERHRFIIRWNPCDYWSTVAYPQKLHSPMYKHKNKLFKKFFSLIFFTHRSFPIQDNFPWKGLT